MAPREKWTDERLDDLKKKVDGGFSRVDADIRELRTDMNAGFQKLNDRFDALNRTLLSGAIVLLAAIIGSNVF